MMSNLLLDAGAMAVGLLAIICGAIVAADAYDKYGEDDIPVLCYVGFLGSVAIGYFMFGWGAIG